LAIYHNTNDATSIATKTGEIYFRNHCLRLSNITLYLGSDEARVGKEIRDILSCRSEPAERELTYGQRYE